MATISLAPVVLAAPTTGSTITPPTFVGTPPEQSSGGIVVPAADITGVILAVGSSDGQEFVLLNESAHSITFAASGTSNVADGAASPVVANTGRRFKWSLLAGLWYRLA